MTYFHLLRGFQMKKTIALIILTAILLTSCAACGDKTANLNMLGIGDSFTTSYHTESGQLSYTINNIQWSDNVRELGVDPNAFDEYASVFGGGTSYVWPNYVDLETGQLKEHLMFVLVDLTVTNIDALSKPITENDDGVRDDSWYTFGVNYLSVYNLSEQNKNGFSNADAIWYTDTGDYDPTAGGTSGSNFFILRTGESLTYRLGFVIGSGKDDFSQMCLTDGGGSFGAKNAVYIPLGIPGPN